MEFNLLAVLFLICSLGFLGLAIYTLLQYKGKKKNSLSLEGKILKLQNDINESQKQLEKINFVYERKKKELQYLLNLDKHRIELKNNIENKKILYMKLTQAIKDKISKKDELDGSLQNLQNDISIYSPTLDLINVGYFEEPDYLYETSDRFKEEIKIIREKQKILIKENQAILIPDTIALTSNSTYTKKILRGQANLMLKAFNVECDNLMMLVRPSNFSNILERIDKIATDIEKSSISLKCGFNKKYIELKFKECELQYQYKLKESREKEEQKIIQEQIREEQKAIREFERAIAKAQKEESMYKEALEEAQKQLSIASEKEKEKLLEKVNFLQRQLQEAMQNEQRAKSMAEQTKRGHVYIISNVGSFGENVFKIGLTRRLDPFDRVKELGDASVPFLFDVHAMIYSEDAPNLERLLHEEFRYKRVNVVNHRKEFFKVSLKDIQKKVNEITGGEAEFKMTALAEEYYESKKLRSIEEQ